MKIDIVIVNWNAGLLLRNCVESVNKYSADVVSKVVIVDNGSSDGSVKMVSDCEGVTLVQSNVNLGFGRACNLGASYCDSEFILFLNPDACLHNDTLSCVLKFMGNEKNSNVGICGVQLENENGEIARSCSRFPSVMGLFSHAVGLSRLIPRLGNPMSDWDHLTSKTVDQVIGAFFFVRRRVFDQLQGFDERFFVYFEEVDFAYRAKILGWSNFFVADAQAFHLGGGVSRQVKSQRLFYSSRSRIQYAFKHFDRLEILLVILITFFVEPICRVVLSLGKFSFTSFKETVYACIKLYSWSFNLLLRRK